MGCGCKGKKLTKEQQGAAKERKLIRTRNKRQRTVRKLHL